MKVCYVKLNLLLIIQIIKNFVLKKVKLDLVIITEKQYNLLIRKYGFDIIKNAILILENWLKTNPSAYRHRGKNNYAHFRSDGWVINEAKRVESSCQ